MGEPKLYWLISVPRRKSGEEVFDELQRVTAQEKELSVNSVFTIPDLRVGNIDSLISLSDALKKVNNSVEQTLRKIAQQYFDLQKSEGDKASKKTIDVKGTTPDRFLRAFKWDESRYPKKKSLTEISTVIKTQVIAMEKDLRDQSMEYNSCVQKLAQIHQNESGSLLTRDLSKDLADKKFQLTESEHLTTLLVVIPKSEVKNWYKSYETLTEYVAPRSSHYITDDVEYALVSVVLFNRVAEEFKNKSRALRFTVRKNDSSNTVTAEEKQLLLEKADKLKKALTRWTLTNFGEAFSAWVHLKCIQCYVESILRFGLPAEFVAMLLLPKKGQEKRLERTLVKLYPYLGRGFQDDDKTIEGASEEAKGALAGIEKFYPYVFLDINLEFTK